MTHPTTDRRTRSRLLRLRARAAGASALVFALMSSIASAAAGTAAAVAATVPRATETRALMIDVKGTQTTNWTMDDPSTGPCDPALTGSGTERLTFHSTRPRRFVVRRYGPTYVLFGDPYHLAANDLPVYGSVVRNGHTQSTPVDPSCGQFGGGGNTTPPDCGEKSAHFFVDLGYANKPPAGFTLTSAALTPLTSPFTNCPWTGGVTAYPNLLQKQGRAAIVGTIPAADLFNRDYGQQIVLAGGTQRIDSAFVQATTRIRWSVRLTAIKR